MACFAVKTWLDQLLQLLTRDPSRRLGSGKEDAEEIKRHPFFKDVNFNDVLNKTIEPPYYPKIVSLLSNEITPVVETIMYRTVLQILGITDLIRSFF
jgi:hypothetical protein